MASDLESQVISGARELIGHEVLLIDGDVNVQKGLIQLLAPLGLQVTTLTNLDRAGELLATKFFAVVIIDLDTPSANAGVAAVKKTHEHCPTSTVLVLSPRKSFDAAVTAFRAGAHDVIVKAPDQVEYLKQRILTATTELSEKGRTDSLLSDVREAMDDFLKRFMAAERRALDLENKDTAGDSPADESHEELRILVVDVSEALFQALERLGPECPGRYCFALAQTGGEALDRVTSSPFHVALVADTLPDLPGSLVVKALKSQAPELTVLSYRHGGPLEIVEMTRKVRIIDRFTEPAQLASHLGDLTRAHRARERERRYLRAFRERHYEFLRRFSELKRRLEKAGTSLG
ncbi:MAG: response regulator [Deltaproteobacteria bacterium]|nr:response regulator [Deltaproteobacteria bacterium]